MDNGTSGTYTTRHYDDLVRFRLLWLEEPTSSYDNEAQAVREALGEPAARWSTSPGRNDRRDLSELQRQRAETMKRRRALAARLRKVPPDTR